MSGFRVHFLSKVGPEQGRTASPEQALLLGKRDNSVTNSDLLVRNIFLKSLFTQYPEIRRTKGVLGHVGVSNKR